MYISLYIVYTSYFLGVSDKGTAVKPPPSEALLHLVITLLDILFCIDYIKSVRQQCSIDLNRYIVYYVCNDLYYTITILL